MKKLITICVVTVVMVILTSEGHAAYTFGYSVQSDGDDNLYRINLNTGACTKIGPVGYEDVEGLSFQPGTGVLFGWNNGGYLITINLSTGAGTPLGPSGISGQFDAGLTFDSAGHLFVTRATTKDLYAANPTTGAASFIGSTDPEEVIALADAGGGNLWGVSQEYDGQPLYFVSINKSTAATTVIGSMGLGSGISHGVGIDYAPDGTLWGIADSGQIFTINTVTGQASVVASSLSGFEGLAIVPEPATMILLALGSGAVIRKRRQ
jgi:hypothetical protein